MIRKIVAGVLVLVINAGGLNFYSHSPVEIKTARAAYSGRQIKTVEYILGGGTDNTSRGDNVAAWAGSTWSATKGGAGTSTIILEGTNIKVKNAYLETNAVVAAAFNVNNVAVTLDVENGPNQGVDVPLGEELSVSPFNTSGLSGNIQVVSDVTALFSTQSDSQFQNGVGVIGKVQIDGATGFVRSLTSLKLVISYELDYSTSAHNEVKTVRFPLISVSSTDNGTKGAACPVAGVCGFGYRATLPDAAADSDILNAWFEIHAEINSSTASTLTPQISGGTVGPAFNWVEAISDDTNQRFLYQPPIGGSDLQRNVTSTLNITMGTIASNFLGGELVVTYRYSTGASEQTETVRYFAYQNGTAPGAVTSSFSISPNIANTGAVAKNIWMRIDSPIAAAQTMTWQAKVGSAATTTASLTYAGSLVRGGKGATFFMNLSSSSASFSFPQTTITGGVRFSSATGDQPISVEVYVTFTWSGSSGGAQTKTAYFGVPMQGTGNLGNQWYNRNFYVFLPESVTKIHRSSYLSAMVVHSEATTIALGTVNVGVNGASTTVTEYDDTESYTRVIHHQVPSSTFTGTASTTITWEDKAFVANMMASAADEVYFSGQFVATYEVRFPNIEPTYTQSYYRFYVDNSSTTPEDPWPTGTANLGENGAITASSSPPAKNENVRLRMSLTVGTRNLATTTQSFKLQFSLKTSSTCSGVSLWDDLGNPGSATVWRGHNNASTTDGDALGPNPPASSTLISVSDRAGTYEESNNTSPNPYAVISGENVEYDWNIEPNNATSGATYCFRMTESDGTPFANYNYYPEITTSGYRPRTQNWRFFDDETSTTPTSPMADENIAPSDVGSDSIIKLRLTLKDTANATGTNVKFKLQFSTFSDFSADVNDVVATSSCVDGVSKWCYADGAGIDNATITSSTLSDANSCAAGVGNGCGTHNETPTSSSNFTAPASASTEFEFTLRQTGAPANTVYFFRPYYTNIDSPVEKNTSEQYPSVATDGAYVDIVAQSTINRGDLIEGATTTVTSTATSLPFGALTQGIPQIAAQRLTITTNAGSGYQVTISEDQQLTNSLGELFTRSSSTNNLPLSWTQSCLSSMSACYGYHSGDDTLSGSGTSTSRFAPDDSWAAFSTSSAEVIHSGGPVSNQSTDILFKIEAHPHQQEGNYSNIIYYVITAIF